ncbi:MAG: penicillin-insensitive murein endopeptidase [Nannocystaceae bacterium]
MSATPTSPRAPLRRLVVAAACLLCAVAGLGLLAPPARAEVASDGSLHVVRKGESLSRLARAAGCTIADVQVANDLGTKTVIYPGQPLFIPNCAGGARPSAATLSAAKAKAAAGQAAQAKAATVDELVRHRVRKGESLSRIAKRYGCSPSDIRARNNMRDNTIHPGQLLLIPGGRGGGARFEVDVKKGQSVGKPHRGKLVGGVQLPHDKSYYRRRTARAYGAAHTVAYTRQAITSVRARYPKIHRLAVGDLSSEGGGSLPGHRSHQSGRDVDLGLYYRRRPKTYPKEFAPGDGKNLDLAATWALVDALLATRKLAGGVEHIFLDYGLQRLLYKYAKEHGASAKLLAEVFQYPHGKGRGGTLIQHVPAHHDHIHVRYKCPAGDRGCQ